MKEIMLILLIIFAAASINTRHLRHSVIYLGVFSLCISLVYLLYNAPDIALAEAVIGSALSTILYLIALQKYKIFTIYCKIEDSQNSSHYDFADNTQLIRTVKKFCIKQELEPQIIHSPMNTEDIISSFKYAVIIEKISDRFLIHGHRDNYQLENLSMFLINDPEFNDLFEIDFVKEDKEEPK